VEFDSPCRTVLHERLRRAPTPSAVPGSLPVLFFGDLLAASVATVGLNPSDREYLDKTGRELVGPDRRFETLRSLGAADRASLTDEQCQRAIDRMRAYYRPGRPVYSWFRSLDRVVSGMGLSYESGGVVHLDLVQEATHPTWSGLGSTELAELRSADEPFLRWQLEAFPLTVALCNGRTVFEGVLRMTGARMVNTGKIARLNWYVAVANMSAKRTLAVVGWNIPLARPTGLDKDGHVALGRMLAEQGRVAGLGAGPLDRAAAIEAED
jgi:hypothetical protein